MDLVDFSILSLAVLCGVLFVVGYFFHNYEMVNPISAFVVMELVVVGLLSVSTSWYVVNVFEVSPERLAYTVWIHMVYGISVIFSYLLKFNPLRILFSKFLKRFSLSPLSSIKKLGVRIALILGAALSMAMLVFSTPDGILWIIDTRSAYINLRAGYGHWWVMYQVCIVLLYIANISACARLKKPYSKIFRSVLIFCGLMYFTGSKSAVLIIPIIASLYIHFNLKKLKIFNLIGLVIVATAGFVVLLNGGNDTNPIFGFLSYFPDYVAVTALNMEQIDIQGHTLGYATLSSLWYWVPRSLVSDKPYEWGAALLNNILFPGSAEQGHTPGVLLWITYYMDFGFLGVVFHGIFIGSFSRATYDEYIRTRDAGTFMLLLPFCFSIVPVSAGSSVLFLIMAFLLWLIYGKTGMFVRVNIK